MSFDMYDAGSLASEPCVKDPASFLPLNPREFLVLFALVDRDRYGYGIVKWVNEESAGDVRLDPANLYRILKRLIRDGLVTQVDQTSPPESDNDRRRFYAITKLGAEVVAAEAARLDRLASAARKRNLIPRSERTA